MKQILYCTLLTAGLWACNNADTPEVDNSAIQATAQKFIDKYTTELQKLYYISAEAQWKSNTEIIEGDTMNAYATKQAEEAYAKYTGSKENIDSATYYLSKKDKLTPLQIKQFETMLYAAANNPEIVKDLVKKRIKAETEQTEKLYGFEFMIDGKPVTPNEIDRILDESSDLEERLAAWRSSKTVGINLKSGLENLRNLRNQTVQALGYDDYFTYQVSDYGMTRQEMMDLNKKMVEEIWPLFRELHTWARYTLAEKYHSDVPEMLPAHWLPNRWGQDWAALVKVEGLDLDGILSKKEPEWIIKQSERFYISLGFPKLPQSFWDKSSLYPPAENATYKKNNHASAWHMDLEEDVRCLMSVVSNSRWYETSHHELGHIYYYQAYTNPEVPPLMRGGANRGYHEAFGSLLGLAAMQKPFLENLGLLPEESETDDVQILLKEALNYVVFIPWSAGVMTEFEEELYSKNLSVDEFNKKWWDLKTKYQGIVAPSERGEEFCDPASKTHINNDAAQYYDYAVSYVLLFQFHDYIAKKILKQDPHATNYYGNKGVGKFLRDVMYPGATRDWRELLKESTGEEMSARAMLEYFEPLMAYLKEVNKGRVHTLIAVE